MPFPVFDLCISTYTDVIIPQSQPRQLTINTTSMLRNPQQESCDWSSEDGDDPKIYTPSSSTDSENEMIATPTSSTASEAMTESPPFPSDRDNDDSQPLNSSAPNQTSEDRAETSPEDVADEEDISNRSMWGTGVENEVVERFDSDEVRNAVAASTSLIETALENDIQKALKESLELLDRARLDYEPATREQHRIQSAYVEALTTEPGYHSKEDDEFFFEEVQPDENDQEDDEEEDEDKDKAVFENYEIMKV
jgi:hypothetical protein